MGHAAVTLWAVATGHASDVELNTAAQEFARQYALEREFFAVGPNVWGRGQSAELAKAAMKKANGGRLPKKYNVNSCPAGTEISLSSGGLMWPGYLKLMGVRPPYSVESKGLNKAERAELARRDALGE